MLRRGFFGALAGLLPACLVAKAGARVSGGGASTHSPCPPPAYGRYRGYVLPVGECVSRAGDGSSCALQRDEEIRRFLNALTHEERKKVVWNELRRLWEIPEHIPIKVTDVNSSLPIRDNRGYGEFRVEYTITEESRC